MVPIYLHRMLVTLKGRKTIYTYFMPSKTVINPEGCQSPIFVLNPAIFTHPIPHELWLKILSKIGPYQIRGATQLRIWKLRRCLFPSGSCPKIPIKRTVKAAVKMLRVIKDITVQKLAIPALQLKRRTLE